MYQVNEDICTGCGDCVEGCPSGAIALVDGRARIDQMNCAECGSCASTCPEGAISMVLAPISVHATSSRETRETSLLPALPSTAAVESVSLARPKEIEVLPVEPRGSRVWPMVGSALVWMARDFLPAALQAWQETAGRVGLASPMGRPHTGRAGGVPGRRQNRRRYAKQAGSHSGAGSGSPKGKRC